MRHIAFYISGHGYSHAVRAIEIIKALSHQNPYLFFHIKTTTPQWFFRLHLDGNYLYYQQDNDIGAVQHDYFEIDKAATLARAQRLLQQEPEFVDNEVRFLQQRRVKLVIGDLPPAVFAAAAEAGLPAVAVGNFSWDWIYAGYLAEFPEFAGVIRRVRQSYGTATLLLRPPLHGGLRCFARVIDIPLITRHAVHQPRDVRRLLKLTDDGRPLVLIALRAADLQRIHLNPLAADSRFAFVAMHPQALAPGIHCVDPDCLPFQDLVSIADVVVAKPSYSIVADCLAQQKPLLYTTRTDFREYRVLARGAQQYGTSEWLPASRFFAGQWAAALNKLLRRGWQGQEIASNGAEVAAAEIQRLLEIAPAPAMGSLA